MSNESERTWPLSFGMLMEGRSGLPTAMPEWWPLYGELPVLSILPLTAMLTYQGKRTLSDRRKHRRKEGIRILLYGLLVAALGIMSFRMVGLLIPALLIQVMAHEYITLCS